MTSMTQWLASLEEDALTALLARRGDAALVPQPRTLPELAARLQQPASLAAAIGQLPRPGVQLAEALCALGAEPTRESLAGLVGDVSGLDDWLAVLHRYGLVWPGGDGALCVPMSMAHLFGDPLGLGTPLSVLVANVAVAPLRKILSTLGVSKPPTRRDDVVDEVCRVLSDAEFVRGVADTAPRAIGDELRAWAHAGETDELRYDPVTIQARMAAARWGAERGLAFGGQYSYDWQMPAEVARALRGPDYRAPFDPDPPDVAVTCLDPDDLAAQAADAVTRFAALALAVVDRLARTPLPALKSGGVGAREIAKLVKALGGSEIDIRLALELLAAIGVIDSSHAGWELGTAAETWRALAPADRVLPLLLGWWWLLLTPGESRDDEGKTVPALKSPPCEGCLAARHGVVEALAELGPGASAEAVSLGLRALWRRPFVHLLAQDGHEPFATQLAEAEALGVVASGAVTRVGTAVLADDVEALRALLADVLPAANDTALFGADLTAVVPGAPTARVSRLLDTAADRESRGGATVWRFSAGSVRRALDEGYSAESLRDGLAAIATGELPQPLRYLVDDIGRQHGNLRVGAATSVIRGPDEALLAQVAADKALRKLGLRVLAPTVLGADADAETVLAKLRAAGYLPVPDGEPVAAAPPDTVGVAEPDEDAALDAELREMVRQLTRSGGDETSATWAQPLDPAALAAQLLAAPMTDAQPASATERQVAAARLLSSEEIRILAYAIDTSSSVGIVYRSQSGGVTRRVISQPELMGESIFGWCGLRDDERWFRLERIQSVFPVG